MSIPAAGSIDMLKRLVAFDTTSRNSNLELIRYIQDYLDGHGVTSTLVPNAEGTKANLFASIGPETEGGVVLSGHTDVVPVDGQPWTHRPVGTHREVRRQPLRPRHLRHEGFHRRLPRPRAGLAERPAESADASRLQLRRGDRLPGRPFAGRTAGRRRAAAAGGDRGRAHHDGRGQRAECRRRHRRHLHRRRSPFLDDPSWRRAPSTSPATSSIG